MTVPFIPDGGGNAFRVGFPSFGQNATVGNVRQADFFRCGRIQLSPANLTPLKTPFDLVIYPQARRLTNICRKRGLPSVFNCGRTHILIFARVPWCSRTFSKSRRIASVCFNSRFAFRHGNSTRSLSRRPAGGRCAPTHRPPPKESIQFDTGRGNPAFYRSIRGGLSRRSNRTTSLLSGASRPVSFSPTSCEAVSSQRLLAGGNEEPFIAPPVFTTCPFFRMSALQRLLPTASRCVIKRTTDADSVTELAKAYFDTSYEFAPRHLLTYSGPERDRSYCRTSTRAPCETCFQINSSFLASV